MAMEEIAVKAEEKSDLFDSTEDFKVEERPPYKELITRINIIAKPLACKKLTKKLYKTIRKGTRA